MTRRQRILALAAVAVCGGLVVAWSFHRSVERRKDSLAGDGATPEAGEGLRGMLRGTEQGLEPLVPGGDEHLHLHDVRAVLSRPGETWIGTAGGLRVLPDDGGERIYGARSGLLRNDVAGLASDGRTIVVAHPEAGLSLVRGDRVRTLAHPDLVPTAVLATDDGFMVGTADSGLWLLRGDDLVEVPIAGEADAGPWSLDRPRITALAFDREARLWVGTFDRGLAVREDGAWSLVGTDDGLADPFVTSIAVGRHGDRARVLVGTQVGMTVFDGDRWEIFGLEQGLPHDHVMAVAVPADEADDALAVGTFGGGVGLFEGGQWHTVREPDLPSPHVQVVRYDERGRLWIGTRDGLVVRHDGLWESREAVAGPPGPRVTALESTPDGQGLWAGTFERGLGLWLDGDWRRFGTDDGLPSAEINALELHRGVLWVATNAGVAWFGDDVFHEHPRLADLGGIAVTALFSDGDALWFGSSRGVVRLGGGGEARVLGVRDGLVNAHVYALALARGWTWAGTLGGLSGLATDGTPRPLDGPRVVAGPQGLASNWVNALLARDDTLWVGTYGGGVDRLDDDGWQHVVPEAGETLEINPGAACWAGERAVFGTLDQGLLVLDEPGVSGHVLDRDLGLASPSVTALHTVDGDLWIGSNAGLQRVALATLR
jgi:ligand-binding sensor domain-containing protein